MTQPHQCRCAICGEIGVIVPLVPNVYGGGNIYTPEPPQAEPLATCAHGYTICAVCKFPAP